MNKEQALKLVDAIMDPSIEQDEKRMAADALRELISLLME